MKQKKRTWYKSKYMYISALVLILAAVIVYNSYKPLPEGLSFEGDVHYVDDIDFIYDLSYKDLSGKTMHEQRIFDSIFQMIDEADSFIVIDMFLFNGYYDEDVNYPALSGQLTERLIKKKQENSDIDIVFITDEVNTTYQSYPLPELEMLKQHDIDVVVTNLDRLRDPNPLYSAVYRTFFQWFGEEGKGWIVNPMASSAPKVTARSYLRLMNIKANHRKVVATEKTALITSANPHDASGFHSNIAFQMSGNIIGDFVKTEEAVARFSRGPDHFPKYTKKADDQGEIGVQLLTEGKIYQHIVQEINNADNGNTIWIAMFYLADRKVVHAITDAAERGVSVKLILDPNQNAFGSEKIGLPNLPVAAELQELGEENISIRWYNTDKEQFHTKLMMIQDNDESTIIGGSANYTERNLDDYNLEANVKITAPNSSEISQEVDVYFKRLWNNEDGYYTSDYEEYQDKLPVFKYLMYRVQKLFKFTTY